MNGAAFVEPATLPEAARLLRKIADQVAGGSSGERIVDTNGNECGRWWIVGARP